MIKSHACKCCSWSNATQGSLTWTIKICTFEFKRVKKTQNRVYDRHNG